jgi:hypothetical protein
MAEKRALYIKASMATVFFLPMDPIMRLSVTLILGIGG